LWPRPLGPPSPLPHDPSTFVSLLLVTAEAACTRRRCRIKKPCPVILAELQRTLMETPRRPLVDCLHGAGASWGLGGVTAAFRLPAAGKTATTMLVLGAERERAPRMARTRRLCSHHLLSDGDAWHVSLAGRIT
jgi:hypothetical protein